MNSLAAPVYRGVRLISSSHRQALRGRARFAAASLLCGLLACAGAAAGEPVGGAHAADASDRAAPRPLAAVEGAPAVPALRLAAMDGGTYDLAAAQGVTVVHFFATWCVPCRTELPALARFAERMPQVALVLADVAEGEARVRRFLAATPGLEGLARGRVVLDPDRAAARAWEVSLLPSTFVIAEGRMVLAREGEVAWDGADNDRALAPFLAPTVHKNPKEQ